MWTGRTVLAVVSVMLGIHIWIVGCGPAGSRDPVDAAQKDGGTGPQRACDNTTGSAPHQRPYESATDARRPKDQSDVSANSQRTLVITWRGEWTDEDDSEVTYFANGQPLGKGRTGFSRVVNKVATLPRGSVVRMPRDYMVGVCGAWPPPEKDYYMPPYWRHTDLLQRIEKSAQDRHLVIEWTTGWEMD